MKSNSNSQNNQDELRLKYFQRSFFLIIPGSLFLLLMYISLLPGIFFGGSVFINIKIGNFVFNVSTIGIITIVFAYYFLFYLFLDRAYRIVIFVTLLVLIVILAFFFYMPNYPGSVMHNFFGSILYSILNFLLLFSIFIPLLIILLTSQLNWITILIIAFESLLIVCLMGIIFLKVYFTLSHSIKILFFNLPQINMVNANLSLIAHIFMISIYLISLSLLTYILIYSKDIFYKLKEKTVI